MPRQSLQRVLATLAIVAATLAGVVVTAAPASALNPCFSDTPPDGCFEPPATPSAPTGLRATAVLQTSVTLTWNALGTLPLTLTRTVNGQTTTVSLKGATTTYTDSPLPAGATVAYALWGTACNTYGCTEGRSASLTVTTRPVGTNPIGSATGAVMNYYGAPTNPDDRVSYSMSGWTLDYDTTGPISVQLTSDGQPLGAPITANATSSTDAANPGYGNAHGFTASWLRKASGKGLHNTCAIALNVGGGSNTQIGCFTYKVPGPPAAATNVNPVPGPASVTVTFTDNADDETGFYVQRTTDAGQNWLQVGALNAPVQGVGGIGRFIDYSVVGSGVCYRIVEQNTYGQTVSQPGCTP